MSTQPTAVNPNTLSAEELADQLANAAAPAAQTPEPLERDFSVVLETGQTYKGKTKDEVIQQLVKAQENASRRIKELSDSAAAPPTPQQVQQTIQQAPKFDANQYYQLLATDPIAANDYYAMNSPLVAELNKKVERFEKMEQEIASRTEFVTFQNSATDFDFSNQEAINKFDAEFPKLGLPWTAQNLLLAHNHFVRTGIYQPKAAETQTTTERPQAMPTLTGQTTGGVQTQKDPNRMSAAELKEYIESLQGQV